MALQTEAEVIHFLLATRERGNALLAAKDPLAAFGVYQDGITTFSSSSSVCPSDAVLSVYIPLVLIVLCPW